MFLNPSFHRLLARTARWRSALLRLAALECDAEAAAHEYDAAMLADYEEPLLAAIAARRDETRRAVETGVAGLQGTLEAFLSDPPPDTPEKDLRLARALLRDGLAVLTRPIPPPAALMWSDARRAGVVS